jgi:hypothetical protein
MPAQSRIPVLVVEDDNALRREFATISRCSMPQVTSPLAVLPWRSMARRL